MNARRQAALLILDGARPDVVTELAARGDLPNISRYLLEPGKGLSAATTVFPSTTGVAYLPFLTGCYPGRCDVPGIRWLDPAWYGGRWVRDRAHVRSYCGPQGGRINEDLPATVPTLFDLVPDSVGICTPFTRGLRPDRVRASTARALFGGLAHYTGGYEVLERTVARALVSAIRERPRFIFAVFPGVDGLAHLSDPWHPRVLAAYRAFDTMLADYAAVGGFDEDQLTIVASDHGMTPIRRHTDISLALEGRRLPTLRHPLIWRRGPRAAVMVSGNASAQVYLRPGERRARRVLVAELEAGAVPGIPSDLVRWLAELPGVALVAGEDAGGRVSIVSRAGRAEIVAHGEALTYAPLSADVLEVGGQMTLSPREWLAQTVDGRFPDAPVQLAQLFASRRAGDLVIAADETSDLRDAWELPEHRAGHGSLVAEHMRCVVAATRPLGGLLRTVDVFPALLDWLGLPVPSGVDGAVPAEELV